MSRGAPSHPKDEDLSLGPRQTRFVQDDNFISMVWSPGLKASASSEGTVRVSSVPTLRRMREGWGTKHASCRAKQAPLALALWRI
jgi:hypothetical protein